MTDTLGKYIQGVFLGVAAGSTMWVLLPAKSATQPSTVPPTSNSIVPPPDTPKQPVPSPKQPVPQKEAKGTPPGGTAEYGFTFPQALVWGPDVHTSLVRRFVGAAEGNLGPDGSENPNNFGHKDPGNFVWNRGAFSYQFGNQENLSPEEADKRQFAKIKRYYDELIKPYNEKGLLTELETWAVIDMVNQAPLCVGYGYDEGSGKGSLKLSENNTIDLLVKYKKEGMDNEYERIIKARVESFKNPSTGHYDTTFESVYWLDKDQRRRLDAIIAARDWIKKNGTKIASAKLSNYQVTDEHAINEVNNRLFQLGVADAKAGRPPLLRFRAYQRGYTSISTHASK